MKLIDVTGQRFGTLTVLGIAGRSSCEKVLWNCRCDCGNEIVVPGGNLRHQKSCGCTRGASQWARQDDRCFAVKKHLFQRNVIGTAKARNIPVLIGIDTFIELSSMPCHYCGSPPSKIAKDWRHGKKVSDLEVAYNGLDRVDNEKPYSKDNVVPCCYVCNRAKSNMPHAEFLAWLDRLVSHHDQLSMRAAIHV